MKIDRSRLPEPGPTRRLTFPLVQKSALASGLRVWSLRHPGVPLVCFLLLIRRGAANDPTGRHGLAAITADMLDEGSGTQSAIEIHESLARMGAQFDTEIGADATVVTITTISRFADRALMLMADLVARPTLAEADFLRVRQLRLHRLMQLRDMPSVVADRAFVKLLYGELPYGHTAMGNTEALAALTIDDVRAFHAAAVRPSVATLVAVGDCDHAWVERVAGDAFGGWQGRADAEVANDARPPQPARLNIISRPGAPQSELRIGHVAVARNTPDYYPLVAANMVLGGQFVSRINLNLREDKGFTYGARSSFDFRRSPGPFLLQASVQTTATARAIEESLGEIAAIRGPRPVTKAELAMGVAALTRGYARNFETAEQVARALAEIALYDLPDDYFAQFVPTVERVTTDDVTRVASRNLDPQRAATLIVGDLNVIGADLAGLGLGDPVILPADTF